MNNRPTPPSPQDSALRIAFVHSCWHEDIIAQGKTGFEENLHDMGLTPKISAFTVPGAFELPLQCKKLARTGDYDILVAAGFVVDGGIYRHEFVADAVIKGLMQVQLELELPVLSMVLTPHHFHETQEHREFFFTHFRQKGHEAAAAVQHLLGTKRTPV